MENLIYKRFFKTTFYFSINLSLFFLFLGILNSGQTHAFFESHVKYSFQNKWLIMLSDNSSRKIFQAMKSFLIFPELGLPVLRNSIKKNKIEKPPTHVGTLIGILGDLSDVPYLLDIWRESQNDERSKVFFGAIRRIYSRQKNPEIEKTKLSLLSAKFLKNELNNNKAEKTVLVNYKINNFSKSYIFLRVNAHFWKTITNENLSSKFVWLGPGEELNQKIETNLIPTKNTKSIRLDFRISEVDSKNHFIHKTIIVPK